MKYLFSFVIIVTLFSCQKGLNDDPSNPLMNTGVTCYLLKQSLREENIDSLTKSLGNLLNASYSNENLNQLAADVSEDCDVNALLQCFDCVKTVPPQSQMHFGMLEDAGDSLIRIVNMAPATGNKIKIVNIN